MEVLNKAKLIVIISRQKQNNSKQNQLYLTLWLKAVNNYPLICTRSYLIFFLIKVLSELGIFKNSNTKTYSKIFTSKYHLQVNANYEYCAKFGLKATDKHKDLPVMYWLPKMHNNFS